MPYYHLYPDYYIRDDGPIQSYIDYSLDDYDPRLSAGGRRVWGWVPNNDHLSSPHHNDGGDDINEHDEHDDSGDHDDEAGLHDHNLYVPDEHDDHLDHRAANDDLHRAAYEHIYDDVDSAGDDDDDDDDDHHKPVNHDDDFHNRSADFYDDKLDYDDEFNDLIDRAVKHYIDHDDLIHVYDDA